MDVTSGSVAVGAFRRTGAWIGSAVRDSLTGRVLDSVFAASQRAFGESRVFGLQRSGSRRLERTGHPWSALAISRPYHGLRDRLDGSLGNVQPRAGWFGEGRWVYVLGAGIFALGCGRVASQAGVGVVAAATGPATATPWLALVPGTLLVIIGILLFAAGPRLLVALSTGAAFRGMRWFGRTVVEGRALDDVTAPWAGEAASLPLRRRAASPLGAGVALAVVAGLAGGLIGGAGMLAVVGFAAALSFFALLLWRPEALLFAVALFPWIDWMARQGLGGFGPLWDDALLLLAIALLLWSVIVQRRSELWTVPILLPTFLAFVAALGSVVIREVPSDIAFFALRVLFQPLLFYFLGFLFPKDRRTIQWVVALFLAAGLALALHGLYQYVTHAPMPLRWIDQREVGSISTRAYSIVGNPNGLAAFLLLGSLLSLSLSLTRGLAKTQRLMLAAVCVVHLVGVAVTFSRGAWLGAAAGILALVILAHRRYLVALLGVGALGWLVMPRQFSDRLAFGFSSTYIAKSLAAGRLYTWKIALDHVAAHPLFGVGLGTFGGTSAALFGLGRLWVDNSYLQLAAEGGLLLLVFFLWILVRGAKGLLKAYMTTSDPYLRGLTAGVFGAWVAVAVANATASVWETLVVGAGFWFLGGLATSAVLHPSVEREGSMRRVNRAGSSERSECGA